ncbi:group II intron maturase-specific domain-containing protein [Bradyrhizobium sp. CCBAU 11361]|uniref:group II intron maturase-specific domain-containing protein n=1 Tax=Bradyrhizobium sp. CCBAU 11361 TaxID=1630812 RepID=UPI0023038A52|nr:group II intron maturase-specific domain-containing protein [Bradyrhizobium sp. CCBAU 11361]
MMHAIGHCRSEAEARDLCRALETRFAECGLRLHPEKTKIVYCKDANRSYPEQSVDFLGYTFRPRMANNRHGERFVSFSPAVSKKAGKRMRHTVRRWRLHRRSDLELVEIAKWVRPVLTGWVRYYGRFYPSKLQEELRTIDAYIVRAQHENTNFPRTHVGGMGMVTIAQATESWPVRPLRCGINGWMTGAG